jgi:hypothetical protein
MTNDPLRDRRDRLIPLMASGPKTIPVLGLFFDLSLKETPMKKVLVWLLLGAAGLVGSVVLVAAVWAAYFLFLALGLE